MMMMSLAVISRYVVKTSSGKTKTWTLKTKTKTKTSTGKTENKTTVDTKTKTINSNQKYLFTPDVEWKRNITINVFQ